MRQLNRFLTIEFALSNNGGLLLNYCCNRFITLTRLVIRNRQSYGKEIVEWNIVIL